MLNKHRKAFNRRQKAIGKISLEICLIFWCGLRVPHATPLGICSFVVLSRGMKGYAGRALLGVILKMRYHRQHLAYYKTRHCVL